MQNKGLIKLFALLFGLVSIYQLSYTFITDKIETAAETHAVAQIPDLEAEGATRLKDQMVTSYLDSIGKDTIYGFTTYNVAKKKQLNKGLDLEGGINVTLQISIKDILIGLANKSTNPVFTKALADTDELSTNNDDTYLNLFFEAFDNIKGDTKLASPDIFANKGLSEEINFEMSDDQVKPIIRTKIDEAIVSAFEVLRERIDGFGVTQPNIQRLGTSGRVLIELPGAKDVNRAIELVTATAQLEFWETWEQNTPSFSTFLIQANEKLKTLVETPTEVVEPVKEATELDSLLNDVATDSLDLSAQVNPLFDKLLPPNPNGNAMFSVAVKDTAAINSYLKMPEITR